MPKRKQHEATGREEEREKKKARKAQETEEEIEKEKQAVGRKEQETRERISREREEAIIHYAHHWSFTVIDTKEGKMQRYDSMVKAGHKEANEKLKRSLEEIFTGKQLAKRMGIRTNADTATNGQGKLWL